MVRSTMAGVIDGSAGEVRVVKVHRSKVTFSRAHEAGKPRGGDHPQQCGAAVYWRPGWLQGVMTRLLNDSTPVQGVPHEEHMVTAVLCKPPKVIGDGGAQEGRGGPEPGAEAQALVLQVGAKIQEEVAATTLPEHKQQKL